MHIGFALGDSSEIFRDSKTGTRAGFLYPGPHIFPFLAGIEFPPHRILIYVNKTVILQIVEPVGWSSMYPSYLTAVFIGIVLRALRTVMLVPIQLGSGRIISSNESATTAYWPIRISLYDQYHGFSCGDLQSPHRLRRHIPGRVDPNYRKEQKQTTSIKWMADRKEIHFTGKLSQRGTMTFELISRASGVSKHYAWRLC